MDWTHIRDKNTPWRKFGAIRVQNLFNKTGYRRFSVAKIELVGKQPHGYDSRCDIAYYVLKGHGTFTLKGKTVRVEEGDLVVIPKNNIYTDDGKMILLAISAPRFGKTHVYLKEAHDK